MAFVALTGRFGHRIRVPQSLAPRLTRGGGWTVDEMAPVQPVKGLDEVVESDHVATDEKPAPVPRKRASRKKS